MKTLFKILFKIIALAILLVLAAPILYLTWRMSQPMDLPEFNGLTYYQLHAWERMATEELVEKYEASHPDKEYTGFRNRKAACLDLALPIALLGSTVETINEGGSLLTFPNSWWHKFETITLSRLKHKPHGLMLYCRIQPDIPTPDKFEAMKLERAAIISASQ